MVSERHADKTTPFPIFKTLHEFINLPEVCFLLSPIPSDIFANSEETTTLDPIPWFLDMSKSTPYAVKKGGRGGDLHGHHLPYFFAFNSNVLETLERLNF